MPIRVLSVDGGGMRGLYTASYLHKIELTEARKMGVAGLDVGSAFDLIVGTSTGAIIGCGLALGMSPGRIATLYEDNGAKIFPSKVPKPGLGLALQLLTRPSIVRKGELGLRTALEAAFGATTVGELWTTRKIAIAITAVNMRNSFSWVFKTPHLRGSSGRDNLVPLVDVCLASSAAPIFRSIARVRFPKTNTVEYFCDGGLWANNPVMVAFTEALRMIEEVSPSKKEEGIEIFCLGNCSIPEGSQVSAGTRHRGLGAWKLGAEAATVSIGAQEFAFDNMARMLSKHLPFPVKIHRFPRGPLPASLMKYLDMDETSTDAFQAYRAQAASDADKFNSMIDDGEESVAAIVKLFRSMSPKEEEPRNV